MGPGRSRGKAPTTRVRLSAGAGSGPLRFSHDAPSATRRQVDLGVCLRRLGLGTTSPSFVFDGSSLEGQQETGVQTEPLSLDSGVALSAEAVRLAYRASP